MLLIVSDNTDIYFSLAAEDYLLHHFSEDIFMIWRSSGAVVCGKHQNICGEINYGYCRSMGISPARRLTGGGTVFHDLGNVNFTFIRNIPEGIEYAVDYRRFLEPLREALKDLGVHTEYSSRNDLLIQGKKISGNAEHVLHKTKRVLHHGTLLFSSDLQTLGKTLRPDGIFMDKAVKSVRSEVTNIQEYMDPKISVQDFIYGIVNHFDQQKHTNQYVFSGEDLLKIQILQAGKYQNPDWIVGYSPPYSISRNIICDRGELKLRMKISKGIIEEVNAEGNCGMSINKAILDALQGQVLSENLSFKFAEIIFDDPDPTKLFLLF